MVKEDGPLAAFLAAQGVVVLDGGIGTQLQAKGVSLDPKLWYVCMMVSP